MSMSAIAARAAALLLTSEKGRKGVGFLLVAIFAPVILIAAILCSTTSGGADHNNSAVEASFYGVTYSEDVPDEFRTHIADMQTAFSFLDSAVAEANATMTDGNRLDPIQVKAIFMLSVLARPRQVSVRQTGLWTAFFITEQRTRIVVTELEDGSTVETEEVYTATVPLSLAAAYENLAAKLGKTITDEDKGKRRAHLHDDRGQCQRQRRDRRVRQHNSNRLRQRNRQHGTGYVRLHEPGWQERRRSGAVRHPCLSGALGLCVGNVRSCIDRRACSKRNSRSIRMPLQAMRISFARRGSAAERRTVSV